MYQNNSFGIDYEEVFCSSLLVNESNLFVKYLVDGANDIISKDRVFDGIKIIDEGTMNTGVFAFDDYVAKIESNGYYIFSNIYIHKILSDEGLAAKIEGVIIPEAQGVFHTVSINDFLQGSPLIRERFNEMRELTGLNLNIQTGFIVRIMKKIEGPFFKDQNVTDWYKAYLKFKEGISLTPREQTVFKFMTAKFLRDKNKQVPFGKIAKDIKRVREKLENLPNLDDTQFIFDLEQEKIQFIDINAFTRPRESDPPKDWDEISDVFRFIENISVNELKEIQENYPLNLD